MLIDCLPSCLFSRSPLSSIIKKKKKKRCASLCLSVHDDLYLLHFCPEFNTLLANPMSCQYIWGEKNLEPVSYLWWAFNSTNYSMIVKKKKKKMRDWPSPSQSALHRAGALKVCALLDQLHQHHWGLGRNADLKLHTKHTESETLRGAQSSTVCGVTSPSGDSDEQSNVRTSWQRNIYWLIVLVISW